VNGSDYDASEDVLERMILSIRLENADYCRENLELNGYLAAAEARVSELEGALTVYQMAFHDACVDAHPEDEGFQEYKLQNLRDAEVELKMLDVVVPEFMKELGMEHPVSRPAQNGEDTQK
jgi:hypothetical protein